MINISLVSDLHFHRHARDNQGAERTLKAIKANFPDDYLMVTGDITDDGHETQYERALQALKPFDGRIFICPGNHDFGALGNFYSRKKAEHFDKVLARELNQGGTFTGEAFPVVNNVKVDPLNVMFIALDTNLETDHPFDFACGEVGEAQLKGLKRILDTREAAESVKILFFHHHPFIHNNPFMELKDARQLWRTVYGRVDVMAFGHRHVMGHWSNQGGIKHVIACDNSPGKRFAPRITIGDDRSVRLSMDAPIAEAIVEPVV